MLLAGIDATNLAATPEAIAQRDALLVLARKGKIVNSPESAQRAGLILKDLKAFTRLIEATRNTVKAPVIKLGKDIDALATTLVSDIEGEEKRIGGLIATYQEEQRRLEQEARRKAFEEQERIRKEAEEKERLAREAAEAEARKAREEQEKADRERAEAQKAMAAQNTRVSMAVAPKIEGLSLRSETKFEVTDIQALYDACPMMVLLSPNNAAIKAQLKTMPEDQSLPGVKHWKEAKTSVR
jgi:septal ring factor EnvC (AmiA/AmiB activator)